MHTINIFETSWLNSKAELPTSSPLLAGRQAIHRETTPDRATLSTPTTTSTPAPTSTDRDRATASTSTPTETATRAPSSPTKSTASAASPARTRASTTVIPRSRRSVGERHKARGGHLQLREQGRLLGVVDVREEARARDVHVR
jgi:hypothetical protein